MLILGVAFAVSLSAASVVPLVTPAPGEESRLLREQCQALKRIEAELVLAPARREMAERHELFRRLGRRRGLVAERLDRRGERPVLVEGAGRATAGHPIRLDGEPRNPRPLAINVRVNSPPVAWTQSEVGLAVIGQTVVAAWNDGVQPSVTGSMSFGVSADGGRTWGPSHPLPLGDGLLAWEGDPVIVADARRGEFWLAALGLAFSPPANAVVVMHGALTDTGFAWSTPVLPRATRDTLPDKPWIAVDPTGGAVVLSYTTFFRVGARLRDRIEIQRSDDAGTTWTAPFRVSATTEEGLVQGSRPIFGPDGELHVVWSSVDTSDTHPGLDFIRLRTSRDGGASFESPVSAAGVISNFASGAPGYNRPNAINFPSIAVDLSTGPHRGRVYVSWAECVDFYSQRLLARGAVAATPGSGVPTPFVVGDVLHGRRDPGEAPNRFTFPARRGQTAMFYLDSLTSSLDLALEVGCGDNPAELVFSDPPVFGRQRVAIATFAHDGDYTLTLQPRNIAHGDYRIRTGWVTGGRTRGRDVRDAFVAYSDGARVWSNPSRVSDAPPWTDDWLPEVAVAPDGRVYAAWYDWRDMPSSGCGASSNVSLARSEDGGNTWRWLGSLSDQRSDWSATSSNLVPNQGDYIGLSAGADAIVAGWADARGESPDIYFARVDPAFEPVGPQAGPRVAISGVRPNPAPGEVMARCAVTPGLPARLELWDVAGRRLHVQGIDAGVTGLVAVRFTPPAGVPSGVYLLRLVQGAASTATRLAIVR